ncbi:hypothetical protein LUZ63_006185 [Rhynchospora breviuscula]|uniref:Pentatricopeptide repeat-containing protein-mitochondrial domain-containing protein n=1 Tax=Rhynchospora breviuscula TaxID=2022672 RepID=A0A9Q0CPA2_9POAL|nr:hypothetical protein LUZ63_006185 [Rhynchospora breviuscula]
MLALRRTATSLRLSNKHFICAAASPTSSQEQPDADLLPTSRSILEAILTKPRFETLLPSLYPSSLLLNPSCISLTISPLSHSHPLLSIRYLLFLSNLPCLAPSPLSLDSPALTSLFLRLLLEKHPPGFTATVLSFISNSSFLFSDKVRHASLSAALRIRQPDLVFKIHEKMPCCDRFTHGLLIRAMCVQGRLKEAYCFLKDGLKSGFVPDILALTKLVSVFSKAGNFGMVSHLLHLMIEVGVMPDAYTYQSLIHGLCHHGLIEEALRVFNEIKFRGYKIDLVTYSTIINGLCKTGRIEEVRTLWEEMLQKGFRPNNYCYCTIIDAYCKIGDFNMAQKVYDEMLMKGLKESTVSYNVMIGGLALHGRTDEALKLFDEMPRRGIARDVVTYNTLIQAFCRAKEVDKAINLYREVISSGMEPHASTFTPIIEVLCEDGKIVQAIEFIKSMDELGLERLERTNDCIIKAFCKAGMAGEGMAWLVNLLKNNKKPKRETLNKLIEALCSCHQVQDALLVVNAMVEMRYHLEVPVWQMLVEQLCRDSIPSNNLVLDEILPDAWIYYIGIARGFDKKK